jgi:hypothetical protein
MNNLELMRRDLQQLIEQLNVTPISVDASDLIRRIGELNVEIANLERLQNAARELVKSRPVIK